MHPDAAFPPGFRFSLFDGVVLACGACGAVAAAAVSVEWAVLGVVALLHFFLFCNVFRVARSLELAWSAFFVACVGVRSVAGVPWPVVGAAILSATVLVVWREARKESYHGVLWRRWNPRLAQWWASKNGGELLFVVADVFAIDGQVILAPGLDLASPQLARGSALLLRRPDGTELAAEIVGIEFVSPNVHGRYPVRIAAKREDVPIGTAVWSRVDGVS